MAEDPESQGAGAANDWEAILSEPIASVRDEGWRAMRRFEDVTPRPQAAPTVLAAPVDWLTLDLPMQDDDAPANATRLPASLAEQLSLTHAARRRRSSRAADTFEAEAGTADIERAPPAQEQATSAGLMANEAYSPSWRTPLRLLARLLPGRGPAMPRPEAPHLDTLDGVEEAPEAPPPETRQPRRGNRRPMPESADRPVDAPTPEETEAEGPSPIRPSLGGGATLPIVLARQSDSNASRREPGLASRPMPQEAALMQAVAGVVPQSASEPLGESETAAAAEGPKTTWRAAMASLVNRLIPARPSANAAQRASAGAAEEAPAASTAGLGPSGGPALVHRRSADVTDIVPASEAERPIAGALIPPGPVPGPVAAPEEVGEPLSPVLRERLEGLVDVPLTEVRIFRGPRARKVTSRLGADAVSAGTDVYLAPGAGNAETPSGRALLAHEVSHVAHRVSDRAPPLFDEEQSALRLEHAVQRQELQGLGLAQAGFPGFSPFEPEDVNLQSADPMLLGFPRGRRTAAPGSTGPERMLSLQAPPSVMAQGGVTQIARAGSERSPGLAEPGRPAEAEASSGASADRAEQEAAAEEEANLIERAVESVLRRLRRDGDLDRERRGSFRSEIGG